LPGDRARLAPHRVIERAPAQQEEQQHGRRIEIRMAGMARRLDHRHAEREDHAERNRHVHVERARADGAPGAAEERLARIGAAGSAISAESQWKKSRVSCGMSVLPDQTDTDSSMMFMPAKPATARHFTSQRMFLRSCVSAPLGLERMRPIADVSQRAITSAARAACRASRPRAGGW
jgi:hypothetical protein